MTPEQIAQRVRSSFEKQAFMTLLGVELQQVSPGRVQFGVRARSDLTQQHGFLHAGVLTAALDSACGYAALSAMDEGVGVLSVEFKVNLIAPAAGDRFRVVAEVLKSGRTLTICRAEAHCVDHEPPRLIAAMQGTMMSIRERPDVSD